MVSARFIPPFIPFMSISNLLDAERFHTSILLWSAIRCLYSIILPVLGFRMTLIYSMVALSDTGYTMLWLGVSIVFNSVLTMIDCTYSALNSVMYLCMTGFCFQLFVWIGGLFSSLTSSTLVDSTALRVSTLCGVSLTLGS